MNPHQLITQQFAHIKGDAFLNAQSKRDRLMYRPFKFIYIFLWQWVQSFLIYALHTKSPLVTVKTFWGEDITMVLPRPSFLYFFGFLGKSEVYLTDYLLQQLKPGDVFIDGGANIGFYSLLASQLVGDKGSVHAFEPGVEVFPILQKNVGTKPNSICNNLALWRKKGEVLFSAPDLKENLYGTIMLHTHPGSGVTTTVSAISIDEYCNQHHLIPTCIKLDTEGTELDILKGAIATISTHHPILIVEILKSSVRAGVYDEMSTFLKPYNYTCVQLVNYAQKEIKSREDIDTTFYNFVFIPM